MATTDKDTKTMMMEEQRKRHISSYRATTGRAVWELGISLVAYVTLLCAHGHTVSILGTTTKLQGPVFWIVAPFVHLRLFMIFHDLGHGSFCPSPKWNKIWHRIVSVIVMTPSRWRESHRRHHQHFGNIDNPIGFQWNDTVFFTKTELEQLRPMILRKVVQVIRYPLVFFPIAAFYEWYIRHRIPVLDPASGYTTKDNLINTISVLLYARLVFWLKGDGTESWYLLFDMLISAYFSAVWGLTVFHTQHAFEDGYRRTSKTWDFSEAAFQGSSCTVFPWFLQWSTMGIGYHHIHHYDPRVPGYLLKQCHEEGNPSFWKGVPTLDSMPAFWKALWTTVYDEQTGKFVYD